ncbi:MAG: hypothetical protein HY810_09210 [Candidatus Omnitrophica bacterium]|nr:hypothetical protein [Candidatus Omnitrophota bacterium]
MITMQKWFLVGAALVFSLGILFLGLHGRYEWKEGQDFGRDGAFYPPRLLDTWTGKVRDR